MISIIRFIILIIGWGIGLLASVLEVSLSYKLDVPTAPLIVASLDLAFFFLLAVRKRKTG